MQEFCFVCDYEDELPPIRKPVTITVRGEPISATKEFYQCPNCGHAFTSSLGHDALEEAYREYRSRHGMLQPEEIRNWREQYGLTQHELSHLLGWEETTLSKYENGALQEESQDTLLKFAMEPINLLQLIKRKPEAVDFAKRATLIEQLSSNQSLAKHLEYLYAAYWQNGTSEKFMSNKHLDFEKKQFLIKQLQILKPISKSPFA
jgi:putative zinc finger/helix-turn-helix YgiT family protein